MGNSNTKIKKELPQKDGRGYPQKLAKIQNKRQQQQMIKKRWNTFWWIIMLSIALLLLLEHTVLLLPSANFQHIISAISPKQWLDDDIKICRQYDYTDTADF